MNNWLNILAQCCHMHPFLNVLNFRDVNQMSVPYEAISKSEEVNQVYPIKKVSTLLFI
jgi:hypothetical protein